MNKVRLKQTTEVPVTDLSGQTVDVTVTNPDIRKQYVAQRFLGYFAALQQLPNGFDDLTKQFGYEVYRKMLYDAEVNAGLEIVVLSTANGELKAIPNKQPNDIEYQASKEVSDFWNYVFQDVEFNNPFQSLTRNALSFGSAVGELQIDVYERGAYFNYYYPKSIDTKEPEDTNFVVDSFNNVIGVVARKIPQFQFVGNLVPLKDKQVIKGILPAHKFLILSWMPTSTDPRGTSILRPAYTAWWIKQQVINEMLDWLAKYAQPSIWATLAQNAVVQCIKNPDGTETRIEPADLVIQALQTFKNSSVMVFPYGTELHTLDLSGTGDIFLKIWGMCNQEITRAILNQHLATNESEFSSRASSEVHQTVLQTLLEYTKGWLLRNFKRQVIRPITVLNFGEKALDYIPDITLGGANGLAIDSKYVAQLQQAQYFTQDQLRALDRYFGLPIRD